MIYSVLMDIVNTKITEMPKKVGRPPGKMQDRPFNMKVNDAWMAKIDDWRRQQPDFPTKAEAIRRLVEQALSTGQKGKR
jgi:hypothetical protein